ADGLVTAKRMAKTGDDLIEDEHASRVCSDAPQILQEPRSRENRAYSMLDRFGDDGGNLTRELVEQLLNGVELIESSNQGLTDRSSQGSSRKLRPLPKLPRRGVDIDPNRVVPTVIRPLEFDDLH